MAVERRTLKDIMAQQQQALDAEMGGDGAPVDPAPAPARAAKADPPPTDAPAPKAAARPGRTRPKSGERRRAARRKTGAGPKYMQMEPKTARLRDDQLDGLTVLARQLMRAREKGSSGERITENTLLRVAVDVLLDNADLLAGDTEDDLAESITTELRKFRTSEA